MQLHLDTQMNRCLLLVVALSGIVSTIAFAPSVSNVNQKFSSFKNRCSALRPSTHEFSRNLRMSDAKEGVREIDFGKVAFEGGSESGFSGMVFRPEDSEEPESRCRVDWHEKCEKVVYYAFVVQV